MINALCLGIRLTLLATASQEDRGLGWVEDAQCQLPRELVHALVRGCGQLNKTRVWLPQPKLALPKGICMRRSTHARDLG